MSLQATGTVRLGALRVGRYLPLSVVVTAAVTALPLVAVERLGPTRAPAAVALHVLLAVVLSILIARLIAALWSRHERSSDLVFGDLLLWGWIRRALAERRLEAASRELVAPQARPDAHAGLLRRLSSLLEARDPYTHGHSRRVARHSERIARELGLPPEQVARVRAAALVHDIGKINIPRPILTKAGKLTDTEFAIVKRHPTDGAAMVASLGDAELTAIVRSHHERIDGTGYPDGLAGVDIPLGARIIAVADTFDAITSSRPYRGARTHKQALEVLEGEAGTQLDAAAVGAFVSYYSGRRAVGWVTVLVAAPQRVISGFGGFSAVFGAGVAPLAQTACGVGGAALVGACLGGSPLPEASVDGQAAHASGKAAVVADASPAKSSAGTRATDGAARRHARRNASVTHGDSTATPSERVVTPRALRAPSSGSPGDAGTSQTHSGVGGGAVGDTTGKVDDTANSLPVQLPDPDRVVQSVTGQLPQVQPPSVQLPPVGLP
jgi:putative nucleotidyltransferase with HDIG domain